MMRARKANDVGRSARFPGPDFIKIRDKMTCALSTCSAIRDPSRPQVLSLSGWFARASSSGETYSRSPSRAAPAGRVTRNAILIGHKARAACESEPPHRRFAGSVDNVRLSRSAPTVWSRTFEPL
jgi:hypothetical protein